MIKIPFDDLTYIEQQTLKAINRECVETDGQSYMKILKEPTMEYYMFTGLFERLAEGYDKVWIGDIKYFEDFNNQIEFFNKYKKDIIDEINSYCIHESMDVMDVIRKEYGDNLSDDMNGIWSYDFYKCIYEDIPATQYYEVPEYTNAVEASCYWCVKNSLKKLNKFLDKK